MKFTMAADESDYLSTFHNAIEFSLKKLGKPKLELKREQYDAIRAICFERKDALAVLPTGFGKSLVENDVINPRLNTTFYFILTSKNLHGEYSNLQPQNPRGTP